MRLPLPAIANIRDFYAFEQHVKTCRKHRGLDMVPEWYKVPVFYFSNPAGVIGHDDPVSAPKGSKALDYELELACVIGKAGRDIPADDSALDYVAGFTIMNDWSARDLQRVEMAVGLEIGVAASRARIIIVRWTDGRQPSLRRRQPRAYPLAMGRSLEGRSSRRAHALA